MLNLESELNSEQRSVVTGGDGACLVLAGAGSGKTRTITYRVAYLLAQGIKPEQILLVTFTNKAAREMITRVEQLTGGEIRLPWAGTFHHIGFRLLRQYALLLGYKNNFTILDSEDSIALLKLCLKQEGIDRKERRFPSPAVLHSVISYARNAETTIEDVLDLKHPQWLDIADTLTRIMAEYDRRKREANAMDFDDLLLNTHLLLLKSDRVRDKFSEQFQYVLVDEYQDTNKIQASIIRLFSSHHHNILVVGDDAQSIYSFRAADIQNILAFEQTYPGAKIFRLETNYRSTSDILRVANDVIANNKAQYQKELRSLRKAGIKPEVHVFADATEEAESIATRILELRDEGMPLQHMAVLFRAAFHSQALEMELTKRDIPYDYRGGVRFFERAHVKDVLCYLRIFHNPEDQIAWSRVLTMQVGIGPSGASEIVIGVKELAIQGSVREEGLVHLGALLSARGHVGWNDFLQIWHKMEACENKTPTELITAVLNSKYAEYLENEYPDYRERQQDLEQMARLSEREPDVQRFLASASLQESFTARQAGRESTAANDERIVLSTIHQAKGLEWEAVFIMNLAAGAFPSDRSLRERTGIEEERRLFYVAVTRAKTHLYMSYALVGGFDTMMSGPSMFLEELDSRLIDEHRLGSSTDTADDITYIVEDEPFGSGQIKKQQPKSFLKDVNEL